MVSRQNDLSPVINPSNTYEERLVDDEKENFEKNHISTTCLKSFMA